MPKVLQYLEEKYGSLLQETEADVATGAASVSLVMNNSDRFTLTLTNNGANDVYIGLTANVSALAGIKLPANGGQVSMTAEFDLRLPTRQWFGVSPGGASTVHVIEEIGYESPLQAARSS